MPWVDVFGCMIYWEQLAPASLTKALPQVEWAPVPRLHRASGFSPWSAVGVSLDFSRKQDVRASWGHPTSRRTWVAWLSGPATCDRTSDMAALRASARFLLCGLRRHSAGFLSSPGQEFMIDDPLPVPGGTGRGVPGTNPGQGCSLYPTEGINEHSSTKYIQKDALTLRRPIVQEHLKEHE